MLKGIKLQNSTVIFIGILLIITGVLIGLSDYFKEKKIKAFSDMNILLYETEVPENIDSEEIIEERQDGEVKEEKPEEDKEKEEPQKPQKTQIKYNYIGVLEIPKIGLKRGFLDINSKYNKVDYNITVIRGSTFPDEKNNNLILASHSGNCSVCFFHNLYKLSKGDIAHLYYKNIKYSYKITNIYEVQKTGTVSIYRDYSKETLTLITCTRNSNTKQTVYILELYDKKKA